MRLGEYVKRLGRTVVAPVRFSYATGHARSAMAGHALSRTGEPLPWITYPAIDFLAQTDWRGLDVLEFGAGQSTLWWLAQGAQVTAFENDPAWAEHVRRSTAAVDLRVAALDLIDFPSDVRARRFSAVLIDGMRRQAAAGIARDVVATNGCIIQDNSEGFWSDQPGRYEVIEMLADFQRVDFYGFAPGVAKRHCTSIYFRDGCFLFSGRKPPIRID